MTIDGNAVVVVDRDELAQAQRAGQRTDFVRDTLHHATVTHEHVGAVIDDSVPGMVEFGGEQFFRDGHADRIGKPLAKRTGGGLHSRGDTILGVAGSHRM